jgi:hypothetical protein
MKPPPPASGDDTEKYGIVTVINEAKASLVTGSEQSAYQD